MSGWEDRWDVGKPMPGTTADVLQRITGRQLAQFFERRAWDRGCLLWTGPLTGRGYGQLVVGVGAGARSRLAHRVAWTLANGREVPPGNVVMHLCNRRACVNPDHLRAAPQAINVAQAVMRLRHAHGAWHPAAKLGVFSVMCVRAEAELLGARPRDLAARWGVAASTVRAILASRRWRLLPRVVSPARPGAFSSSLSADGLALFSWRRTVEPGHYAMDVHRDDPLTLQLVAVPARAAPEGWTLVALVFHDEAGLRRVAASLGCRRVEGWAAVVPALDAMRADAERLGPGVVLGTVVWRGGAT